MIKQADCDLVLDASSNNHISYGSNNRSRVVPHYIILRPTGRIVLNGTHNAQTFVFSSMKRSASNIKCSALNEAFCTDKKLRG